MDIFEKRESNVRSYCRSFPTVFEKAKGPFVFDTEGRRYLDFFCGAGSLNYGHNPEGMKQAIIEYLQQDGIIHSLDMHTVAKRRFMEKFDSVILTPRGLPYKMQFVAPSGANAMEAALKLARRVTGRSNVIAFTNGYHGLSAGALSVTGNSFYRHESFINRTDVTFMPFDRYFGESVNTVEYIRRLLEDRGSGIDLPAAVVVETIQAEGGVRVAREAWLRELEHLCRAYEMLLIVDDVQVGNGRTGSYFSFEPAGIVPDMVAVSKSISGFGMPLAMLLLRPELDQWKPGEHTGTFRGFNLAFVAAAEALRNWENGEFSQSILRKGEFLERRLYALQQHFPEQKLRVRGRGLIYGLEIPDPPRAKAVARTAFSKGLMIELCGAKNNVLKFLPPLVIEESLLEEGVNIVEQSLQAVLHAEPSKCQGDLVETKTG